MVRREIHSPLISHDNDRVRRPVDQVCVDSESLGLVNLLVDRSRQLSFSPPGDVHSPYISYDIHKGRRRGDPVLVDFEGFREANSMRDH